MADPTSQSPTLLWDVGAEILAAAVAGLEAADLSPLARTAVVAGALAAWDDCCPGQLTVRLNRLFFSADFPTEGELRAQPACRSATLGGEYLVELVACAPGPDDIGNPPPAAVLNANAQETLLRAYAVLRGLMCWAITYGLTEEGREDPWAGPALVRSLEPIGPDGGCVGYWIRVVVALEETCPCADLAAIPEGYLLPGVEL